MKNTWKNLIIIILAIWCSIVSLIAIKNNYYINLYKDSAQYSNKIITEMAETAYKITLNSDEKDLKIEELEKENKELKSENNSLKKKLNNSSTTTCVKTGNTEIYQSYARELVIEKYGWSADDYHALVELWNHESGWNPCAHNSSGAHGIPQALPASKMASFGSDYYSNYQTQIKWGLNYIYKRYGTPSNALDYWNQHHWY